MVESNHNYYNWSHEAPLERTMFEVLLFLGGVAVGVICDEAISKMVGRGRGKVKEVLGRD